MLWEVTIPLGYDSTVCQKKKESEINLLIDFIAQPAHSPTPLLFVTNGTWCLRTQPNMAEIHSKWVYVCLWYQCVHSGQRTERKKPLREPRAKVQNRILAALSASHTLKSHKHLMYQGRTEASVITDLCWLNYREPGRLSAWQTQTDQLAWSSMH